MNCILLSTSIAALGFVPLVQQGTAPVVLTPQAPTAPVVASVSGTAPIAPSAPVAQVGTLTVRAPAAPGAACAPGAPAPQSSGGNVETVLSTIDWSTAEPATVTFAPGSLQRIRLGETAPEAAAPAASSGYATAIDNETEALRKRVLELEARLEVLLKSQEQSKGTAWFTAREPSQSATAPKRRIAVGLGAGPSLPGRLETRKPGTGQGRFVLRSSSPGDGEHEILLQEVKTLFGEKAHKFPGGQVKVHGGQWVAKDPRVTVWHTLAEAPDHAGAGEVECEVEHEHECEEGDAAPERELHRSHGTYHFSDVDLEDLEIASGDLDFDLAELNLELADLDLDFEGMDFDLEDMNIDVAELDFDLEGLLHAEGGEARELRVLVDALRAEQHADEAHGTRRVLVRHAKPAPPEVTHERFARVLGAEAARARAAEDAAEAAVRAGNRFRRAAKRDARTESDADQEWAELLREMHYELRELRTVVSELQDELGRKAPAPPQPDARRKVRARDPR